MKNQYRVYYGYGKSDYVSIPEEELATALDVYQNGEKLFTYNSKVFKGKEIKKIEPDFRYYTGWNDTYDFGNADDLNQIKRDCPPSLESGIERARDFLALNEAKDYKQHLLN